MRKNMHKIEKSIFKGVLTNPGPTPDTLTTTSFELF